MSGSSCARRESVRWLRRRRRSDSDQRSPSDRLSDRIRFVRRRRARSISRTIAGRHRDRLRCSRRFVAEGAARGLDDDSAIGRTGWFERARHRRTPGARRLGRPPLGGARTGRTRALDRTRPPGDRRRVAGSIGAVGGTTCGDDLRPGRPPNGRVGDRTSLLRGVVHIGGRAERGAPSLAPPSIRRRRPTRRRER